MRNCPKQSGGRVYIASGAARLERRRQFCTRCGQFMFEYFRSPDGHFGLVDDLGHEETRHRRQVRCPTCGAKYRLLDRVGPAGQPIVRA